MEATNDEMMALLTQFQLAPSMREELDGYALTLGSAGTSANPVVAQASRRYSKLVCQVNSLLRSLDGWPKDFRYSSFVVNSGKTRKHVDKYNVGDSVTVCFGHFSGGRLWYSGELLDTRMKPFQFWGGEKHATEAFAGSRLVIVAYTHISFAHLNKDSVAFLRDAAFPVPVQTFS